MLKYSVIFLKIDPFLLTLSSISSHSSPTLTYCPVSILSPPKVTEESASPPLTGWRLTNAALLFPEKCSQGHPGPAHHQSQWPVLVFSFFPQEHWTSDHALFSPSSSITLQVFSPPLTISSLTRTLRQTLSKLPDLVLSCHTSFQYHLLANNFTIYISCPAFSLKTTSAF